MRFQADAGLYDPANGDVFLINGRPYCGMGRGYNTAANAAGGEPFDDAMDSNNHPYALLPNPFGFQGNATYGSDPAGPGGANVDYTAADYNNCYLALLLNNGQTTNQGGILPSFFRPELYSYWKAQVPGLATNSALLRQISFRPNTDVQDHPAFSNANPNFDPSNHSRPNSTSTISAAACPIVYGSIPACRCLPRATAERARFSSPPASSISTAASTSTRMAARWTSTPTLIRDRQRTAPRPLRIRSAALARRLASGSVTLPIGQGYGTANINLNGIFSPAEVSAIIMGTTGTPTGWPGRYGGSPGSHAFSQSSNVNGVGIDQAVRVSTPTDRSLLTPR